MWSVIFVPAEHGHITNAHVAKVQNPSVVGHGNGTMFDRVLRCWIKRLL
jgi:hypothetical protein